jgi:beta-lactamase regulating signal transducer with metallopeptidase domain
MISYPELGGLGDNCRTVLQVGLGILIQSTLLLLLGLGASGRLRRLGPAVQSLICRSTLAAVICAALLAPLLAEQIEPLWRLSLPPAQETLQPEDRPGSGIEHETVAAPSPVAPLSHSLPREAGTPVRPFDTIRIESPGRDVADGERLETSRSFRPLLVALAQAPPRAGTTGWLYTGLTVIWLAGTAALLARLALCCLCVHRLRRASTPVSDHAVVALLQNLCSAIRIHPPLLLESSRVRSPFITGLWRPAVLLPRLTGTGMSAADLRAVLAHECAHLARRDCWWLLFSRCACAVLWMQPLLWALCRRMEEAGEELCDQVVLDQGCLPRQYARCLLRLAGQPGPWATGRAAGLGVAPFRSSLGRRLEKILDPSRRPLSVPLRFRASVLLIGGAAVLLGLAAIAAPAPAGDAEEDYRASRAALSGDARLDAGITAAWKGRPLGEALTALGRDLQVPLRASRDTADEKVSLFLGERPAREVLLLLSRHFDFRWSRREDGYELGQSAAARSREAALREEERVAQLAAIHASMERAARMGALPREPLEARDKELRELLSQEDLAPEERARVEEEAAVLADTLHAGRAPAVVIYQGLGPAQVRHLLEGRELHLSARDGTLPPAAARLVRQASVETAQLMARFWGISRQEALGEHLPGGAGEAGALVRLYDTGNSQVGPPPRGGFPLRLEFTFPAGDGEDPWSSRIPWSVEARPLPQSSAIATATDDPALTQRVRLELRAPRARRSPADPDYESTWQFFGGSAWPAGMETLADLGEALHRATGLQIVADGYIRARLAPESVAGERSVVSILDQVANELDYTWRKEGSLIFLRSRPYYRDRVEEVPERILRPWRRQVTANRAATLDHLAWLAAALTDPQAHGVHQYWGWYFEDTPALPPNRGAGGFNGSRQHLRFWAGLGPAQRRAALAGRILPAAQMTSAQRQAFLTALMAPAGYENDPSGLRQVPTLPAILDGGFRLEADPPPLSLNYTFAYHLAGEPAAARTQGIQIIAPGEE